MGTEVDEDALAKTEKLMVLGSTLQPRMTITAHINEYGARVVDSTIMTGEPRCSDEDGVMIIEHQLTVQRPVKYIKLKVTP